MHRRRFLQQTTLACLASPTLTLPSVSYGRDPVQRTAPGSFQIGLAAYSLRPYFKYMKGKLQKHRAADDGAPVPIPMHMIDFLDYCVSLGVSGAELTSYFFTPGEDGYPTDKSLRELRQAAISRSLTICGTAIGNNFTLGKGPRLDQEIASATTWIEKAAILGAPHIRFFAGTGKQLEQSPERIDEAVSALEQCAAIAAEKQIKIGVENHGRLTGDQMIEIMQKVQSPWIGINLDTGNFISEDPYKELARCVPYAVNVQVKMQMQAPDGRKSPVDLERIAKLLRDGGYQGYVVLEYEEDDRFDNIPKALDALRDALS